MAGIYDHKALLVWLPLTKDLTNYGLSGQTFSLSGGSTITTDSSGKLGACYKRTSSAVGRIRSNTTINLSGDLTMCCWAYVSGTVGDTANGIITNHDVKTTTGTGITVKQVSASDFRISCNTGTGSSRTFNSYYGTTNIKDKWCHLALTYNKTAKELKLWVNGKCEYTLTNYTLASKSDYIDLFAWRTDNDDSTYKATCKLNDVRIYNYVLDNSSLVDLSRAKVGHWLGNDPWVEGTTNEIHISKLGGHGSTWTKLNEGYGGTDVYRNTVTTPNTGNNAGFYLGSNTPAAPPAGGKATLSFWVRLLTPYSRLLGGYIRFNLSNGSASSSGWNYNISNWCTDTSKIGKWLYVTATVSIPSNATSVSNLYVYCDLASAGVVDYAAILLEYKDHATMYTNSTRPAFLSDISGLERHGLVGTGITLSADTCRYDKSLDFNGTEGIGIGDLSAMLGGDTNASFTFNCWFKKITGEWSSKSYETILGGPSGFELEMKPSTTNTPIIRIYSWGGFGGTGDFTYPLDLWNMLTMVRTSSNAKFYLNGELKATGSAGTIPAGSYFIGAWSNITGQTYRGKVSDVRIYATALDLTAINELYALGR